MQCDRGQGAQQGRWDWTSQELAMASSRVFCHLWYMFPEWAWEQAQGAR